MTFPMFTDIQVVFDKSSSMETFGNSTRDQMFNLLQDQIKLAEENQQKINISFTGFNENANVYIDNKPVLDLKEVNKNNFTTWVRPDGLTRLYDTIIECVDAQNKRVNEYNQNMQPMVGELTPTLNKILYVITDGYDNQSTNKTKDVHSAITDARKSGTVCILLAANQDAIQLAMVCGFDEKIALTIGSDPHTTELAMGFTNTLVRAISSGSSRTDSLEFSELQRSSSQQTDTYRLFSPLVRHTNTMDPLEDYDSDQSDTETILPPPPPPPQGMFDTIKRL